MMLDDRTLRLIAVGASITANCQPCLETNIKKALENGAGEGEVAEAIQVGKMVRRGAASTAPAPATACCDSDASPHNKFA